MSFSSSHLTVSRPSILGLVRDYGELTKARVTSLVVLTAWCGYYFGCLKAGLPSLSLDLVQALLGIGMVAGGTAALNEVLERDVDGNMRRTSRRPLPTGRMSLLHGAIVGLGLTVGGAVYLGLALNALTGWLSLLTAVVYLAA